MAEVVIRVKCLFCGAPLEVRSGLFDVARARCACGGVAIAKVNVAVTYERLTPEDLDGYREWLVREKGLMPDTAARYARDVEKWITQGKWPRLVAPIEYWREWREKHGT